MSLIEAAAEYGKIVLAAVNVRIACTLQALGTSLAASDGRAASWAVAGTRRYRGVGTHRGQLSIELISHYQSIIS